MNRRRNLALILSSSLLLLPTACGGEEENAEPEATETPETETPEGSEGPETAEAEQAEEPAQPDTSAELRAEGDEFLVELRPSEGYQAGQLGQLSIHVTGTGEWHLNQQFPFSVEVAHADGLTLPKERFAKDDAAEFSDDLARVDVPFTPGAAGEHVLSAQVEFAVCNPESCVPRSATVGIRLAVAE